MLGPDTSSQAEGVVGRKLAAERKGSAHEAGSWQHRAGEAGLVEVWRLHLGQLNEVLENHDGASCQRRVESYLELQGWRSDRV